MPKQPDRPAENRPIVAYAVMECSSLLPARIIARFRSEYHAEKFAAEIRHGTAKGMRYTVVPVTANGVTQETESWSP